MSEDTEQPGCGGFLSVVTQYSADIISLLDAQGRLQYNSAAAERVFGYSLAELQGQIAFDFVHEDDCPQLLAQFAVLVKTPGAIQTMRYRFRSKQGGWRTLESVATNHLDHPQVKAVVSNSRDITERLEQEERRRVREAELLELQKKESLVALAGGIAHDFNNILAIILAETNLLRLGSGDQREAGKTIELAALRASELTKLLLAYAGRGRYEIEPTFLGDLIVEAQSLLQMSAAPPATLHIDVDSSLPAVDVDRTQIRQVVLNLVQNAVEALGGKPGQVRVTVCKKVVTEAQLGACQLRSNVSPGSLVCLEVSDTGCGMNELARSRIFEPFYSTRRAGRGLGLAAVFGIVRGHHCALRLETREQQGTTFSLYFAPSHEVVRPLPAHETPPPVVRLHGKALIIDDEPMTSRATKRLVEKFGLVADQAWDGEDALNRFGAKLGDYSVVILDMVMPRINGAETFERLRRLHPNLPVVMYSGFDDHMADPCLAQARTAFLAKPFTPQRLIDAIARVSTP